MTRLLTMLTLLLIPLFLISSCTKEELAAKVDNHKITKAEVDDIVGARIRQLAAQGQQIDPTAETQLRQRVLGQKIDEYLLLNEAKTRGINTTEQEVNDQINLVKQQLQAQDDQTLKNKLEQQGTTLPKLKTNIEKQLLLTKLTNHIKGQIKLTEESIQQYYKANQKQFVEPETVRASHILLTLPQNATPQQDAEVKKQIEQIRKDVISKKANFVQLAQQHSKCPSAKQGGDLGYFTRGRMVPEFESVVFAMQANQLSPVIKTRFGYHIAVVTDKKPAKLYQYQEIRDRLIQQMIGSQANQMIQQLLETLKERAKIIKMI